MVHAAPRSSLPVKPGGTLHVFTRDSARVNRRRTGCIRTYDKSPGRGVRGEPVCRAHVGIGRGAVKFHHSKLTVDHGTHVAPRGENELAPREPLVELLCMGVAENTSRSVPWHRPIAQASPLPRQRHSVGARRWACTRTALPIRSAQ